MWDRRCHHPNYTSCYCGRLGHPVLFVWEVSASCFLDCLPRVLYLYLPELWDVTLTSLSPLYPGTDFLDTDGGIILWSCLGKNYCAWFPPGQKWFQAWSQANDIRTHMENTKHIGVLIVLGNTNLRNCKSNFEHAAGPHMQSSRSF